MIIIIIIFNEIRYLKITFFYLFAFFISNCCFIYLYKHISSLTIYFFVNVYNYFQSKFVEYLFIIRLKFIMIIIWLKNLILFYKNNYIISDFNFMRVKNRFCVLLLFLFIIFIYIFKIIILVLCHF